MIPTLTLTGFPAGNGTHQFDWRGNNILSGASGVGKSTVVNAMLSLFGAADLPAGKLAIDATTGGNTALSIAQTAGGSRTYERKKGDNGYKGPAWRDFAGWSLAAQDPDLVRAIALPLEWHRLATTDLGRPLRDLFARLLPPADVPARIRAILETGGHDVDERLLTVSVIPKDSDYATEVIRQLLTAQTSANSARDKAEGEASARRKVLAETRENPVEPVDEDAVAAAQETVNAAAEWADYDRRFAAYEADVATYTANEAKRAAWRADRSVLGECPTVDADALATAAQAVESARLAVREAEEAERAAAEEERIRVAVAKAKAEEESRAAADTARKIAEAEERGRRMAQEATQAPVPAAPPPVVPVKRPEPISAPQPAPVLFTPATPEPRRCPACNQIVTEIP